VRVEQDGSTDIMPLLLQGDLRTVRALLAAHTPAGTTMSMTPAMWATYHGHTEMVRLLLEAGANPGAENEHGKTLLEMAQACVP
jgi:uncharacterized protein